MKKQDWEMERQSYEKTIREQKERIFALREKLEAQEILAEKYLHKQKAVGEAILSAEKMAEDIIKEARAKADAIILRAELAAGKRNSEIAAYRAELAEIGNTCRKVLEELESGSIKIRKSA